MVKRSTLDDTGLADRLKWLIGDVSVRTVARRMGVSNSTMLRYLAGHSVPGSFLAKFIKLYNVNPEWLLFNEGPPHRTDVKPDTAGIARTLIELVDALNAVNEKRVGAFSDKSNLRVLHDLNDCLDEYHRLQRDLGQTIGPSFSMLLKEFEGAIERREEERARALRTTSLQMARMCDQSALLAELDNHLAWFEFRFGDNEQAFVFKRRALMRQLTDGEQSPASIGEWAREMAFAFYSNRHIYDAKEACEIGLAVTAHANDVRELRAGLSFMLGMCDVSLGHLTRGNARIQRAMAQTTTRWIKGAQHSLKMGIVLAGALPIEDYLEAKNLSEVGERFGLSLAVLLEESAVLEKVLSRKKSAVNGQKKIGQEKVRLAMLAWHAQLLEALLRDPKSCDIPAAMGRYRKACEDKSARSVPRAEFYQLVYWTQYARLAGETAQAREIFMQAETALHTVSEKIVPEILVVAVHMRNAIELAKHSDNDSVMSGHARTARAFFHKAIRRGHVVFRRCFDE